MCHRYFNVPLPVPLVPSIPLTLKISYQAKPRVDFIQQELRVKMMKEVKVEVEVEEKMVKKMMAEVKVMKMVEEVEVMKEVKEAK